LDYIDTSAMVKLVVNEPETPALRRWLDGRDPGQVSSDLARTELLRAVRKVIPERMALAQQLLEAVTLIRLTSELLEEAGRIDPVGLRSLDAIHLAAALDLGDEVQSFVTYDNRLAAAAARNGLHVSAPV
jgi:predicted nucleic acid-binding protein